ncbi:hypothetical protein PFISCL1PPCAC_27123 [Pristionchus fissidentatus]|uniref:Metalloendopeptidase n=1 Tax=Pristionchus fissidentatus TaxID=1538716 RepID=A0AAV5WXH8_9BILA|nr:hypothetical protein PFISCL1PPCAC_27123 [Pristionchus fissidentatus]
MIIRALAVISLGVVVYARKKSEEQNTEFFFNDGAEYETVLTPEDFLNAASVVRSSPRGDSDIWDSDAMYGRDRFEGDIANDNMTASNVELFMNGGRKGEGFQSNAIKNRHQLWPNGRIPYALSSQYSSYSRSLIASSMQEYAANTCVQWVPKTDQDQNYVYIMPDRGCYSMVGKMGGRQTLSLGSGCIQKGIIIHEMMHAVGFFHEQSRTDRDDFITIMWNNIQPGMQGQFEKYGQSTIQSLGTEYDYTSIMHYGNKAFSRNGQPTIVPKQNTAAIGQRSGFSKVDAYKINTLYGCKASPDVSTTTAVPETQPPMITLIPVTPTPTTPAPPLPTPDSCSNHRGDCDSLAAQGWCQRNPGWMKQYCPVSCGMCPPSNLSEPSPRPTTLPPPPVVPVVPTGECDDLRVDCESLVQQRYCRLASSFMKTYCARSCGFCFKPIPTEVPDIHPNGIAVTSPLPTTTKSLVTLWRTTTPRGIEALTSTSPPPSTTTTPQCRDKKHFCAHWKGAGFCEGIFANYMKKNCPQSCGHC